MMRLVYSSNAVRCKGQPFTNESRGKGRFVLQGNNTNAVISDNNRETCKK